MRSQRPSKPTQFLVPDHSTKAARYVCANDLMQQMKEESKSALSGRHKRTGSKWPGLRQARAARKQRPWHQELRWNAVFLKSVAFADIQGASLRE